MALLGEVIVYREQDIVKKCEKGGYRPVDILVVGATGAGKSTTLNRFFEREVTKEGCGVDPETLDVAEYQLTECLRFWDSPGLGDNVEKDQEHAIKIVNKLLDTCTIGESTYRLIDLVLVIVNGSQRDMGTTYKILEQILCPNIRGDRILVAINQADMALKGRSWNEALQHPEEALIRFLQEKEESVSRRIMEATGLRPPPPISYSARHGYNINGLYDLIIDHIPGRRHECTEI